MNSSTSRKTCLSLENEEFLLKNLLRCIIKILFCLLSFLCCFERGNIALGCEVDTEVGFAFFRGSDLVFVSTLVNKISMLNHCNKMLVKNLCDLSILLRLFS